MRTHDIGVARHIGFYSDAIECDPNSRLLFVSGTLPIRSDGTLPDDISAQSEQVWANVCAALHSARMTTQNLVKISQYLTRSQDIAAYVAVRTRVLGTARPTSTLLVVPALVRPGYLIEIEAVAADRSATD